MNAPTATRVMTEQHAPLLYVSAEVSPSEPAAILGLDVGQSGLPIVITAFNLGGCPVSPRDQ
jgi:hypothetical protein